MKKIAKRSNCPISSLLDIVGDKWSLLIIRDIMLAGKKNYNEFLRSDEKIATNILADRLSLLESAAILRKAENTTGKVRYNYRLTQRGIDLLPVLIEMILWSDKYLLISPQAKQFARQLRKRKEYVITEIAKGLKKPAV